MPNQMSLAARSAEEEKELNGSPLLGGHSRVLGALNPKP